MTWTELTSDALNILCRDYAPAEVPPTSAESQWREWPRFQQARSPNISRVEYYRRQIHGIHDLSITSSWPIAIEVFINNSRLPPGVQMTADLLRTQFQILAFHNTNTGEIRLILATSSRHPLVVATPEINIQQAMSQLLGACGSWRRTIRRQRRRREASPSSSNAGRSRGRRVRAWERLSYEGGMLAGMEEVFDDEEAHEEQRRIRSRRMRGLRGAALGRQQDQHHQLWQALEPPPGIPHPTLNPPTGEGIILGLDELDDHDFWNASIDRPRYLDSLYNEDEEEPEWWGDDEHYNTL